MKPKTTWTPGLPLAAGLALLASAAACTSDNKSAGATTTTSGSDATTTSSAGNGGAGTTAGSGAAAQGGNATGPSGSQGAGAGVPSTCGNNQVEGNETCDDGNQTSCDLDPPESGSYGCRDDCSGTKPIGLSLVYAGDAPGKPDSAIVDVVMDNCVAVGGFQFDVSGLVLDAASGGTAETADFTLTVSPSKVVAFPLSSANIPAGDAVLTKLEFSKSTASTSACLSDPVISNTGTTPVALPTDLINCVTLP